MPACRSLPASWSRTCLPVVLLVPSPAHTQHSLHISRSGTLQGVELPDLPANARYVHHANECYDWGTFGWAILTQSLDLSRYKYFIFMNSSVRGPFFPSYLRVRLSPYYARAAQPLCVCSRVSPAAGPRALVGRAAEQSDRHREARGPHDQLRGLTAQRQRRRRVAAQPARAVVPRRHRPRRPAAAAQRARRLQVLRVHVGHHLLLGARFKQGHPGRGLQH